MEDLYDFGSIDRLITKDVTKIIDELEIYRFYEPDLNELKKDICSPFRVEKTPSFGLFQGEREIVWKDQKTGETGNVIDFVIKWFQHKYKLNLDRVAANNRIADDMKLNKVMERTDQPFELVAQETPAPKQRRPKGPAILQVTDKGWTEWAENYWIERYGIAPSLLTAYHIGHAKEVWLKRPGKETLLWGVSVPNDPIFYFHFPGSDHVKCYRPLAKNKKNKWIMNCTNDTDIQGYEQCDIKHNRPKVLMLQKAMKECVFARSLGVDAIAPHGEGHGLNPDFIRHLKKYCGFIFSFYDNDVAGMKAAIKLKRQTGIPHFFLPRSEAKNITDLWEKDPQAVFKYIDLLKPYLNGSDN